MNKLMNLILFFCSLILIYLWPVLAAAQNNTKRVEVGLVVDYDKPAGRMGLSCVRMAISEFYASSRGRGYKTRLVLHPRDSKSDVVEAASSALDLIKNSRVQAVIGPLTSTQANFVVDLGEKANVPIISFSATSPSLNTRSSYFFRATENEASQVNAIASIVKAFRWKQVVPIYTDDAYGEGLIPFLTDALLEVNARMPYRSVVSPSVSDLSLSLELQKLMIMPTRVFVLHTNNATLMIRVFAEAKKIGMMRKGYVWILTNVMTNMLSTYIDSSWDVYSMNGVLGIRTYVPKTKEVERFMARYRRLGFREKEVNVVGLWAYDAAKALAIGVEKVWGGKNRKRSFGYKKENILRNYSTDLDTFGVSRNGPQLREALSNVRFKGLAGNFSLVHGQLQVSTYEIVNVVNGDVNNVVGFWTPKNGLVRDLNYSEKINGVNVPITWPGETGFVPKGWETPTNGTKLKVGVPLRGGFKEFVNVEYNPDNSANVTGYCIDIFKAVMKELPYNVDYEFIPFANSSHESAGTYDDMVYQVYLGEFDVVVGDVTIRSNRSLYVDFTLPYTESGVSMIVPVKDKKNKNAWVFMKPLTWDLWVTSAFFFIFMGMVVWVLEHRVNEEFRGPPSHQIGTSFWFSFSTLVFAHRERLISNLARFVIIIWAFVVLILTQSYTASLTSLLTVQQLQPTITNVTHLIKHGDNVGYLEASFVYGLLKSLGFNDSHLKVYESPEELAEAFSNYNTHGQGIAAAFDENPYMNVFLRKYCSKYTMIDPTFKTDGFGFAFPIGSPFVADVSRAILTVTECGTMQKLADKWFGTKATCPDQNTQVSSNSLGLESFWGLFLIAGVSALFALAIHATVFFHGQWHVIKSSTPPEASTWDRVCVVFRVFDQKDLTSHTFKKTTQMAEMQGHFGRTVPNDRPISPSTYSNHSDFNFACFSPEQDSSPTRPLDRTIHEAHESNNVQIGETGSNSAGHVRVL